MKRGCKRNCPDHRDVWCATNEQTLCVGICRARVAKGTCRGCGKLTLTFKLIKDDILEVHYERSEQKNKK